jgi:hypothetical protein
MGFQKIKMRSRFFLLDDFLRQLHLKFEEKKFGLFYGQTIFFVQGAFRKIFVPYPLGQVALIHGSIQIRCIMRSNSKCHYLIEDELLFNKLINT